LCEKGLLQGADRVVVIAFTLNLCDTIGKFTAAYLTGSKSLFAEAIHSTMDTVNQLVLLTGIRFSQRNPDLNFPYGYGNVRYVSSLITGCGILSFGCGLSMYHGISGLLHGDALEPLTYVSLFLCFRRNVTAGFADQLILMGPLRNKRHHIISAVTLRS
uniref:Solute carrier family 30 member 9 n=1 Tax=Parascaris equorum TaxID=6256 RepID=A0A914S3E1_PAREQ